MTAAFLTSHSPLSFPSVHPRGGEVFGKTKPRDRGLDKDLSHLTLKILKDPRGKFQLDQEGFLGREEAEGTGREHNSRMPAHPV